LNIADLSEFASEGLLELARLVSRLWIVSEVSSSEGISFFGGIFHGCVGFMVVMCSRYDDCYPSQDASQLSRRQAGFGVLFGYGCIL
jgi:hypothetical protein